ncbi:tripartite tricarboxylate transporter substrate-binding protein, partial [Escherichia coli]|uniref:tripartite tricarboxylate transporter substrate-binding protein n=1 Tax=Escherichia coli TaxID=562 RepID=UPI00207B1B8F
NIRWVVPYPPGGGTDVLARTVAEAMRQTLNQTIVVDNRPGASTNIGAQIVATAKPATSAGSCPIRPAAAPTCWRAPWPRPCARR